MSGFTAEGAPTAPRLEPIELNVCTLALPRLLVGRCVKSFLDCLEDRGQYRLNWICHLDHDLVIKDRGAYEQNYAKTLEQIRDLMPAFDRSTLVEPEYHQGYVGASRHTFSRSMYDIFWIPDDWLWTKPFKLADVLDVTDNWFSFSYDEAEATPPIFYRQHVARYLLAHFPRYFDSRTLMGVLAGQFEFTPPQNPGKVCRHLGDGE